MMKQPLHPGIIKQDCIQAPEEAQCKTTEQVLASRNCVRSQTGMPQNIAMRAAGR